MTHQKPILNDVLAAYVDDEMTPKQLASFEVKGGRSSIQVGQLHEVFSFFEEGPDFGKTDLLPGVRAAIETIEKGPKRRMFRWQTVFVAAVVLLAVGGLAIFSQYRPFEKPSEYRAKSATSGDARARWVAVNVFQLHKNESPVPLRETLKPDDGLLFAYSNLGPEPFNYLMVFGVDSAEHLFWYYPAYIDENAHPMAIPIRYGVSRKGLEEVIVHPYETGPLTIFSLFLDEPVSVDRIERLLKTGSSFDKALLERTIDGVRVKSVTVEVVP